MSKIFSITNIYTITNKKTGVLEYVGSYKNDSMDCNKKIVNAEEVLNEEALDVVKKLIDTNEGYDFQIISLENESLLNLSIAIVNNELSTLYKNANLISENIEVVDISELIKKCMS